MNAGHIWDLLCFSLWGPMLKLAAKLFSILCIGPLQINLELISALVNVNKNK